jgi:type IV secretion system protein VirD4
VRPDDWSSLPLRGPSAALVIEIDNTQDAANSHLAIAKETTVSPPSREFDVADDTDDSALQARVLSQHMRGLARQAALDPATTLDFEVVRCVTE